MAEAHSIRKVIEQMVADLSRRDRRHPLHIQVPMDVAATIVPDGVLSFSPANGWRLVYPIGETRSVKRALTYDMGTNEVRMMRRNFLNLAAKYLEPGGVEIPIRIEKVRLSFPELKEPNRDKPFDIAAELAKPFDTLRKNLESYAHAAAEIHRGASAGIGLMPDIAKSANAQRERERIGAGIGRPKAPEPAWPTSPLRGAELSALDSERIGPDFDKRLHRRLQKVEGALRRLTARMNAFDAPGRLRSLEAAMGHVYESVFPDRTKVDIDDATDVGIALGRFDHHPDPTIDYEIEVAEIEADFENFKVLGVPGYLTLSTRVDRALDFIVSGAVTSTVLARKALLSVNTKLRWMKESEEDAPIEKTLPADVDATFKAFEKIAAEPPAIESYDVKTQVMDFFIGPDSKMPKVPFDEIDPLIRKICDVLEKSRTQRASEPPTVYVWYRFVSASGNPCLPLIGKPCEIRERDTGRRFGSFQRLDPRDIPNARDNREAIRRLRNLLIFDVPIFGKVALEPYRNSMSLDRSFVPSIGEWRYLTDEEIVK